MALRILTQVNYSAGENPEGDSGLHFTAGLLRSLVSFDAELHFYVLVPAEHEEIWRAALSHGRITPLPIELEPRLHGGDFQFCPVRLRRAVDLRHFDFDVLFVNQPETAPALLQFFNRQTFHNVPAVSYVHWFDTRRPSTPKETLHHPALIGALAGMVVSTFVGCNSAFGRERILDAASRWFNQATIDLLASRLRILPPGVDVAELTRGQPCCRSRQRRILVNHRLLKYTGVRGLLIDTFPKLWARRQDFTVLVTNPTRARLPGELTRAPWLTVQTLGREEYLEALWTSAVVMAPHRACHWSISTLEAICTGCVPLMNGESFFREMMAPVLEALSPADRDHVRTHWFYYRGNQIGRLEALLDNLDAERELALRVAAVARKNYDWAQISPAWHQLLCDAERQIPVMGPDNPSMRRIRELLRSRGRVSKAEVLRHLHWAPNQRALSWTAFRKSLKEFSCDDASSAEAVFELTKPAGRL